MPSPAWMRRTSAARVRWSSSGVDCWATRDQPLRPLDQRFSLVRLELTQRLAGDVDMSTRDRAGRERLAERR